MKLRSCLRQKGVQGPKRSLRWTQDEVSSEWVYPAREDDVLWLDPDEFFDLKKASRTAAKQWRSKGFTILLKDTYEHPRSDSQKILNAFVQLPDEDCGRGMERRGSKQHGEERTYLKKRAIQAVLLHQRRLLVQGAGIEELWEGLGDVSADYTRTARIFARRIAKADENTVHFPDPEEGYKVLQELKQQGQAGRRQMMPPSRRGSNASYVSIDSKARCPSSPSSPIEEAYAAGVA